MDKRTPHDRKSRDSRSAPMGTDHSREYFHDRYSKPGRIERPFTQRMRQEAERAARESAPPPEKPKREAKKRHRNAERRAFPWRRLLIGIAAMLALALLALLLFGERGVHHDLPVITPPEAAEETNEG